jgi:hypothetical protein
MAKNYNKKKVALITVHIGHNFGSMLQTIASCEVFKRFDLDPIVVNYIPDRVTYKRAISDALKSVKLLALLPAKLSLWFVNNHIYGGFVKKYCQLSSAIYAKDDFACKCPKADIYVTGSDQVWNTSHNEGVDTHYFWVGINGVKISYASSAGKHLETDEERNCFKTYLLKYKAVSVREQSLFDDLAKLGIESEVLLDPTFMLDRKQWLPFASKRLVKCPYLFVYAPYGVVDKGVIYDAARKVANAKGLKVVTYSFKLDRERLADNTIYFANPGDFLSLMYYADYVITNSFHGTAFSINLNKQFTVIMPNRFSTRIENILDVCGLKDRLLDGGSDSEFWNPTIDYTYTNVILDGKREETMSFLQKSIQAE